MNRNDSSLADEFEKLGIENILKLFATQETRNKQVRALNYAMRHKYNIC
jgi:hypothetical protein